MRESGMQAPAAKIAGSTRLAPAPTVTTQLPAHMHPLDMLSMDEVRICACRTTYPIAHCSCAYTTLHTARNI